MISDSCINQSYSLQGGLVYAINNFFSKSFFVNSTFSHATGDIDLFSLSNTDLTFENCYFFNNTNKMGIIMQSNITMINSKIIDHKGNLFFCYDTSHLRILNSFFSQIQGGAEENMYLEESLMEIESSYFTDIENNKDASSISSGVFSKYYIFNGTFINYKFNCFSISNSEFILNFSVFDNSNYSKSQNDKFGEFGTIFLESCLKVQINYTVFVGNKNIIKGGSISIVSRAIFEEISEVLLTSNFFYQNKVNLFGGSVFLNIKIGEICTCNFTENFAQYGGAIYYNYDKSKSKNMIFLNYLI